MESFEHTRRLAQLLSMDAMGPAELKQAVAKLPRELSYHDFDGKVVNARELLIAEGVQGTTLIPTEIMATVMEGAEPVKCMRNVLPVFNMNGMVMKVPYGESGTYAPVVAEGAEIPISDQTYSSATLTAKKYGVRPLITNEMVEDSMFDIIAVEIRKAGMRIENAINQVSLSVVLENSGYATDFGGAGANVLANTITGLTTIQARNMNPDKIIVSPAFHGALLGAMTTNYYSANGSAPLAEGQVGNILGLGVHLCGVTDTSATYTWGWGTNDYIGALIIDSSRAGAIGMRRDITVERYADTIRDMTGVSVTARFDATYFLTGAAQRLQY